jgi:hypothetical protein
MAKSTFANLKFDIDLLGFKGVEPLGGSSAKVSTPVVQSLIEFSISG